MWDTDIYCSGGGTLHWGDPKSPEAMEVPGVLDSRIWSCEAGRCSLAAFLNKPLFPPGVCPTDKGPLHSGSSGLWYEH